MNTKPNCLKCIHFHITWEEQHPRACKMFGFKSRELPSEIVYKTTGAYCPLFTPNKAHTVTQDNKNNVIDDNRV